MFLHFLNDATVCIEIYCFSKPLATDTEARSAKVNIKQKMHLREIVKTSDALIAAWKCNVPAFLGINNRPTDQPTGPTD